MKTIDHFVTKVIRILSTRLGIVLPTERRISSMPELDLMKNLPLLKYITRKRNQYLAVVLFSLVIILVPGIIFNSIEGSLISKEYSLSLIKLFNGNLPFLVHFVEFVSRKHSELAFFNDTGICIILGLLFPLFQIAEISFYSKFGPMISQLHKEKIHTQLEKPKIYKETVRKYDLRCNAYFYNIIAIALSIITVFLLIQSRQNLRWWGTTSIAMEIYVYITFSFVCYHLFAIGTFKGWAIVKFCFEFFHSTTSVLNLNPLHEDQANGLGKIGQLMVPVYWGCFVTCLALYTAYEFNIFQQWTGIFFFFVFFSIISYMIFVTVPIFLIYDQVQKYKRKQLKMINNSVQDTLMELKRISIWSKQNYLKRKDLLKIFNDVSTYWNTIKNSTIMPFTMRQVFLGFIFYIIQIAQVISLVKENLLE